MRSLGTIQGGVEEGEIPLTLVWVELTSDSTAAGAHVRGTLQRLNDARFRPSVITQWEDRPTWLPRPARKMWRIASVVARARLAPARGVLLARWSPFIALISGRWTKRGRPFVLFVQGNLDDMYDSNPWTRRARWLTDLALSSIREATQVVTPSEGLAEWVGTLRPDGRTDVTVIPNGADVALFEQERAKAARETAGPAHALFFGNMARWQGIDTILDALADPQWPEDLGLRVIGDGQMADAVRACGDPRLTYLGRRTKPEVAAAAARAEISLATRHDIAASATGVSPFKIIESAAAGTPTVVTRVPGQTELAEDIGGSVLIDAGDAPALAGAVARLHADADARAALAERGLAGAARYDWAARADELTEVVHAAAGLAQPGDGAAGDDRRAAVAS
ncbi:glycosyltransferase family 4 protein [Microbacterium sp. HA-8]|jgi:glycosyltransferase involved in cell wall biosynthesis|uniref:glycosyltransferase family 4 protein n=1 Tax=Microbacterium sp. HA-8 TaxID=3234200 RepID=UPI0038F713A8